MLKFQFKSQYSNIDYGGFCSLFIQYFIQNDDNTVLIVDTVLSNFSTCYVGTQSLTRGRCTLHSNTSVII